MDDILNQLERKVRNLIKHQDRLQLANVQLFQGQSVLSREKESMLTKQKKLITQIEAMVEKLKGIEKQL